MFIRGTHVPSLLFLAPSALCAEPERTILVAQRFSQPWPQSRTVACCWRSITQEPLAEKDGLVMKHMSGVDGRLYDRAVRDAPRLTLQLSSSTLPLRASSHVGRGAHTYLVARKGKMTTGWRRIKDCRVHHVVFWEHGARRWDHK